MVGFKRSSKSMTIGNEPKKEKQSETNEPAKPNPPEVKAGLVGKNDDSDFEPEPPSEKETKKFNFFAYKQKIGAPARDPAAFQVPTGNDNSLEGLTFVFTGDLLALSRDEAVDMIKRLGGRVTTAPSSKTSYVVIGEDAGPKKLETVKKLHLKTLNEKEFYDFVRDMPAKSDASNKSSEMIAAGKVPLSPTKKTSPAKPIIVQKTNILKTLIPSEDVEDAEDVQDMLLTEKYAPKRVQDIIGNQTIISKLSSWLQGWTVQGKPGKDNFRAALLSGPPGIGKTTAAMIVSKSLGFIPIEFNASDSRSKSSLEAHVKEILGNRGCDEYFNPRFFPNPQNKVNHVLLMDEVDGMSSGDRGGMAFLIALIKKTKIPIICMCNDRSSSKVRSLANYCLDLRFRKMDARHLSERMAEIARNEGLDIKPNALEQLVSACNSDIRHILNVFSLLKLQTKKEASMTYDDAKKFNFETKKDTELGLFDIISELYSSHARSNISSKLDNYFVDPSIIPLMMHENYLNSRHSLHAKSLLGQQICDPLENAFFAAECFSQGEAVDTFIQRFQEYSLSPIYGFMTCVLPGYFVGGGLHTQIGFPSWLGQNSKQTKNVRIIREIKTHISLATLLSRKQLRLLQLPVTSQRIISLVSDGKLDEAVQFLDDYFLMKEDFDEMLEICIGNQCSAAAYSKIPAATKSSFTRQYNKKQHNFPYPIGIPLAAPVTKEFGAVEPNEEDALLDDVDGAAAEDEESDIKADKMVKQKDISAAKPSSARKKAKK